MPYKQITQLPDNVKNNLPKHAQEIYKEAFNSAEEQYGEEGRARRVAWGAVENKYEKNEKGNWVQKELLRFSLGQEIASRCCTRPGTRGPGRRFASVFSMRVKGVAVWQGGPPAGSEASKSPGAERVGGRLLEVVPGITSSSRKSCPPSRRPLRCWR